MSRLPTLTRRSPANRDSEDSHELDAASRRGRIGRLVAYVVISVLIGYFVVLPLVAIIIRSIWSADAGFTPGTFLELATEPRIIEAARNSLVVGVAAGLLSTLVATPLAFGVTRTNMPGKFVVNAAVLISFISPPFLISFAYILLAGPNAGLVNRLLRQLLNLEQTFGPLDIYSLWGFAFLALPLTTALAYLSIIPSIQNMDSSLEEASRVAGASAATTIWRITLPMMRAGILSGGLLGFSLALAMYGEPYILGINTLTISIRESLLVRLDFSRAAALATVITIMTMGALFLYRRSIRSTRRYETIGGRGFKAAPIELGKSKYLLSALGWVYAIFGAFLPYILLILISFSDNPFEPVSTGNLTLANYQSVLNTPGVRAGLRNSIVYATLSATVVAILGFGVAYLLTRRDSWFTASLDYAAMIPLGIAGTAFAVGIIIFNIDFPIGFLNIYGTALILLAAYVGRNVAFGVRTSHVSLLQVGSELYEASRVAGATEWTTIRRVALPLVRTGIVYAWILSFVRIFPELSASVMLRSPQTEVASTALLDLWQQSRALQRAAAMSMVMFVVIVALVGVAYLIGGRSPIRDAV